MYYFLGYKLFMKDLPKRKKQNRADHTFLLALDGDVDFEPLALRLLVDLMRKDIKVGAACGRIHPIGSGRLKPDFLVYFSVLYLFYAMFYHCLAPQEQPGPYRGGDD